MAFRDVLDLTEAAFCKRSETYEKHIYTKFNVLVMLHNVASVLFYPASCTLLRNPYISSNVSNNLI